MYWNWLNLNPDNLKASQANTIWLKWIFFGCIALILLTLLMSAAGNWRWNAANATLLRQLEKARLADQAMHYHEEELAQLPAPVQRYFNAVLKDGQPMITGAHALHHGEFNMSAHTAQWKPFQSAQHITVHRPGFVWNARISVVSKLTVRVHDA